MRFKIIIAILSLVSAILFTVLCWTEPGLSSTAVALSSLVVFCGSIVACKNASSNRKVANQTEVHKANLLPSTKETLLVVAAANDEGITKPEICEQLKTSFQYLSHNIDTLEQLKLISARHFVDEESEYFLVPKGREYLYGQKQ